MKIVLKVPTSMSTNKKILITIVLVAVSPFTIWLSLFIIPYVWGYRISTPKNKVKSKKLIADKEVETNNTSSIDGKKQLWYKKPINTILGIIIILVATVGGRLIGAESVSVINSNHSSVAEYVSTEHNFKANFKGTPEIERNDLDLQGYKVTQTSYGYTDGNDKYFAISVADYPSDFDMSDTKARLEGTLNGSKSSLENSNVLSSSFIKVGEYDAIDGVIEGTKTGVSVKMYVRNILIGQRLYQIMSIGTAESNIDSDYFKFRDSFITQQ